MGSWKQQLFRYVGGGSVKESNSVVGGVKKVPSPLPFVFSGTTLTYIVVLIISEWPSIYRVVNGKMSRVIGKAVSGVSDSIATEDREA